MSLILKDDLIKACADSYRSASGTAEGIKAGDLAELICQLKTGAELIDSGEVTTATAITSFARSPRVTFSKMPDLFLFYPLEENTDNTAAATIGAVFVTLDQLRQYFTLSNMNYIGSIIREAGSDIYSANLAVTTVAVSVSSDGTITARIPVSSAYPLNPNTYYWSSYKLWNGEEE